MKDYPILALIEENEVHSLNEEEWQNITETN